MESETGDIVDDALFGRNQAVEERLGVDLNFITMPGEWETRETFNGAIRQSVMANDGSYDICGVLSNQLSTLTLQGLLYNLYDLDHLDFSKPWWSGGLLDELSVYDKLYFASGDASLGLINGMMCVFFNKSIAAQFDLPDMYEMVDSGKWTIGKAVELTKDIWQDLDGDGKKSDADRLGFTIGDWNQLYGFIDSFDLKIIEKDSDGIPNQLVYGNEKVVSAVELLVGLFKDNNAFAETNQYGYQPIFAGGTVLFTTGEFKDTSIYRDVDNFDYGVIPMPKWDEAQDAYHTCVRATYSGFCLPVTVIDPDMSAAVLECFASESYRRVSPAYFEQALKVKYARDDKTAQMYDLIKSSVTFKFATAFTWSLGDPQNTFKGQINDRKDNWSSNFKSKEKEYLTNLEKTLETLKDLP
ncbi:MAG: hypothetical protein MJ175_07510 [Clostridia bacterium]|nr:hypothetical protein [Clostridia bacterium]